MQQITLVIDLQDKYDIDELCQLASEAINHIRPGRARLGLALQGAIFRATIARLKDDNDAVP